VTKAATINWQHGEKQQHVTKAATIKRAATSDKSSSNHLVAQKRQ